MKIPMCARGMTEYVGVRGLCSLLGRKTVRRAVPLLSSAGGNSAGDIFPVH